MASSTLDRQPAPRMGMRGQKLLGRVINYVLMTLIALIVVLPLFWMLSTSLKPKSQWFSRAPEWIPRTVTLVNYERLFSSPSTPILRWFVNSLIVGSISTLAVLAVSSLAAYAYARLDFVGRRSLFALLLATLFLPGMLFLVPNFLTVYRLGLLNSFAGVIVPGLAGVFGVFFMRQFFESIPRELEEAAHIDGASTLQTFLRVALPLSRPALATLAIISFLASWNDFLWPLLILKDRTLQTLPPGLRTLQGAYTSEYGQMMAGAAVAAIPVLVLYALMQRYIVASVATTGLKG